jgi:hypothetical protein
MISLLAGTTATSNSTPVRKYSPDTVERTDPRPHPHDLPRPYPGRLPLSIRPADLQKACPACYREGCQFFYTLTPLGVVYDHQMMNGSTCSIAISTEQLNDVSTDLWDTVVQPKIDAHHADDMKRQMRPRPHDSLTPPSPNRQPATIPAEILQRDLPDCYAQGCQFFFTMTPLGVVYDHDMKNGSTRSIAIPKEHLQDAHADLWGTTVKRVVYWHHQDHEWLQTKRR